jgi:hypothetical protein
MPRVASSALSAFASRSAPSVLCMSLRLSSPTLVSFPPISASIRQPVERTVTRLQLFSPSSRPPCEFAMHGVSPSTFQPFSVGLGFRVIPALAGFSQQFEPCGFRFPSQIAGCAFCQTTNNLFRSLRKTDFACLESGPLCSGSPQPIRARKEDKYMLCKNRITLIGFLGRTQTRVPRQTAPPLLGFRSPRA